MGGLKLGADHGSLAIAAPRLRRSCTFGSAVSLRCRGCAVCALTSAIPVNAARA